MRAHPQMQGRAGDKDRSAARPSPAVRGPRAHSCLGDQARVLSENVDGRCAIARGPRVLVGPVQVTCFRRSFRCPAVYDGGSHSSSKSIFINSSTVSWLVGVSSNSVSLKRDVEQNLMLLKPATKAAPGL